MTEQEYAYLIASIALLRAAMALQVLATAVWLTNHYKDDAIVRIGA